MARLKEHIPQNAPKMISDSKGNNLPSNLDRLLYANFKHMANILLKPRNLEFSIPDDDYAHFLGTILHYFARSEKFLESKIIANDGASLDKGLLVVGNNGVGKSFLFYTLAELNLKTRILSAAGNSFATINAHEATELYDINGSAGIAHLFKGQRYFDDVGAEERGSHYKSSEVFRVLIERRHQLFCNNGTKTFMTSNFGQAELLERYGPRVESRIYEMFNVIVATGKDRRKM